MSCTSKKNSRLQNINYNLVNSAIDSTKTDSTKTDNSDNTTLCSAKKEVRFDFLNTRIFPIPNRHETISSIKKHCNENFLRQENDSVNIKNVKFYKRVIVFPTISREEIRLSCGYEKLWYTEEEILDLHDRELKLLKDYVKTRNYD